MKTIFSRKNALSIIATGLIICLSAFFCPAEDVSIVILHTADMHGTVAGRRPSADNERISGGGMLRCATLIRKIRERERNVMLLDCGDFIQGTAESFLSRGKIMMEAAMAVQYDALVPGNHELDWGVENLRGLYAMAGIPVLICNAFSRNGNKPIFENARPFMVREMAGVRVAVIGLNTPNIPNWLRPRLLGDLEFERSVPALRKIMPLVRESEPDIIILAAHQGHNAWRGDNRANEINAVARAFPDIDLIIGGHTHQEVISREVHGVPYTQAGCYGLWLGKATLIADRKSRKLKSMTLELLRVDDSVAPDQEMEKRFSEQLQNATDYLSRVVGFAESTQKSKSSFPGQSQTQLLIARAIAEAVDAEIVVHRALTEYELRSGPIAMRDVWGIVPFENYIGVAYLTLDELAAILEENSKYLDTREFRGVHGIKYEMLPEQPEGFKIRNIRLTSGRRPVENDRIRAAFNSYDMASAGGRFPALREIIERPSSRLEETDIDTRDAVTAYLERHSPINEEVMAGAVIIHP